MSTPRAARLRYAAVCSGCERDLPAGSPGTWNRALKQAVCTACSDAGVNSPQEAIDRGEAGASAERQWHRRRDRHEQRVRSGHPILGGLILAVTDEPESARAWARGAEGEQLLGASLNRLRDEGMAVLHDRRIPDSRANIDHLVVSQAGVFIVDAKRYSGKVQCVDRGSFFRSDRRLYVGGRDRSSLLQGMKKQVAAVRKALGREETPVVPVVCFVGADWGLFPSPLRFGDVRVVWPKMLGKLLRADGAITRERVMTIERSLASALPRA